MTYSDRNAVCTYVHALLNTLLVALISDYLPSVILLWSGQKSFFLRLLGMGLVHKRHLLLCFREHHIE